MHYLLESPQSHSVPILTRILLMGNMKLSDTEECKGKAPGKKIVGPKAGLATERRVLTVSWVLNVLSG